jgi:hypothetical protein
MSSYDIGVPAGANPLGGYVSEFGEAGFGSDRAGNFSGNPGSALFPPMTSATGPERREPGWGLFKGSWYSPPVDFCIGVHLS